MNNANDTHFDCKNLLTDHETWQSILDPAFCNLPGAADCLAHLLLVLKDAIASGPEGGMRAINTLEYGIRMVWPYTKEHQLALELYEIYLSGDLNPRDEPRQMLECALESFKNEQSNVKTHQPEVRGSKQRRRGIAQARR